MKVNVELDCTPEEMRRLIGLPDLTPIHDLYLARLSETMAGSGIAPDAVEAMVRSWQPMGEAGLAMWRALLEGNAPK